MAGWVHSVAFSDSAGPSWVRRHRSYPRTPEALHWLIHIGHYGQSHDHSGRRAFLLLKSRYPSSAWARKNPFYYD